MRGTIITRIYVPGGRVLGCLNAAHSGNIRTYSVNNNNGHLCHVRGGRVFG